LKTVALLMCRGSDFVALQNTIVAAVGPMGIEARDIWVDLNHREVRSTGLVVVAEGLVVQAREMPGVAPEAAMLALVEMEGMPMTVRMGVLRGVSHRVALPLTPQVLGNCSPEAVVDPADFMTRPASQGPLAMGAESFISLQIQ